MPSRPDISDSERLVMTLQRRSAWPETVSTQRKVELIETHISWVLLTDEFAWKIKKPVKFDFLDFSTLEQRRYFCEREVELNSRLAPELYVDVVALLGTPDQPHLRFDTQRPGGDAEDSSAGQVPMSEPSGVSPTGSQCHSSQDSQRPLEFAVRMRRFDQDQLLSRLATDGRFDADLTDALAERIAAFHETAEQLPEATVPSKTAAVSSDPNEDTSIEQLSDAAHDNFEALKRRLNRPAQLELATRLEDWSDMELTCLKEMLASRRREGMVRHCHGDLHLGNIVRIDGQIRLFDCIEFNDEFRWIDVMSEVAFIMMDLDEHDLPRLAWRFLNRYLERTGDYAGVAVLPFFLVYRAMVRAKVDALRLDDSSVVRKRRHDLRGHLQGCLNVAADEHDSVVPTLILMHGVSGSGKTFISQLLIEQFSAIRVRSDVERKRLAGLRAEVHPDRERLADLYDERSSRQTYDRLLYLADTLILSGHPVIVDANFLAADSRRPFLKMASRHCAGTVIINCHAPLQVLRERSRKRSVQRGGASDADEDVLNSQLPRVESSEVLRRDAEDFDAVTVLNVDSSNAKSIEAALEKIRDTLNPLDKPVPAIARYASSASE